MAATRPQVIQLTPPGRGAVATLRVEGPGALAAVAAHFHAKGGRPLETVATDRLTLGHFGGPPGEEVVARRVAEEVVELHCHGGYAAAAMIEAALVANGCRRLAWRDWAAAAANDPIEAAALSALADAPTRRVAAVLLDQYHGALRRALDEIQRAIDQGRDAAARRLIDTLLARAELGRHLVRPWRVVVAGRVNVGKSSLINAMAGYGRSIVHPAPGATRDAVTASTALDGWPVELCDTAGLRGAGERPTDVERAGIAQTYAQLAQADLAVLVFDRSEAWSADDRALSERGDLPKTLLVHNKCDLPPAPGNRPAGLSTSALRGEGVEVLLEAIAERLVPDPPPPGAAVPFTEGQAEAILALNRA